MRERLNRSPNCMTRKTTYIAFSIVFVASLAMAILLPGGDFVRALSGLPAVGALLGALFQIFRDRIAHERSLLVLEAQNTFSIGATSHMANVAFDKHVVFCEEYVAEMFKTLSTMFREGPTKEAVRHSDALYEIRRKWAVWLTPRVETELKRFEAAVREMGAHAELVNHCPGEQVSIEKMFSLFAQIVGFENWKGVPLTADLAVTTVIGKLRKVLGIEELTALRTVLASRALDHLKEAAQPVAGADGQQQAAPEHPGR
ncbi:MAG: hypothetical protein ABSA41_09200 [Terriglobia bacterium]